MNNTYGKDWPMATKTVLISGTSTGIGAACAARMARAGWRVYGGVRNKVDGDTLANQVSGDVTAVQLDVTSPDDIASVVARIAEDVGGLDGLVNNAGITVGGPVELLNEEDWRHQFDVNLFGLVNLTTAALPLVSTVDGRFVHIGSISGRVAVAGVGPYAASKYAVEAFNWALRAELARNTNMSSSIVEPGEIKTAIWDKAIHHLEDLEARLVNADMKARYGFLLDRNRGLIKEGTSRAIEADAVAKAVERALTSSRPKARYLVGADAKAGALMAKMPDRVLERLMAMNAKRLENLGRGEERTD
jgi:NAD(P)-dependent dehydrogenase (short-subunit alcohol dehydrogenase family)